MSSDLECPVGCITQTKVSLGRTTLPNRVRRLLAESWVHADHVLFFDSDLPAACCRFHAQCPVAEEISLNKNLTGFKQSLDGEPTFFCAL